MSANTTPVKQPHKTVRMAETEQLTATSQLRKCKFDLENHGWKGPVTGKTDTLKITRAVKDKKEMMANQDKNRLRHFRRLLSEDGPPIDEGSEDTASICMDPSEVPLEIEQPFTDMLPHSGVAWVTPDDMCSPLKDRLEWQKPSDTVLKNVLSPMTRLQQMEGLVAKKETEMEILRNQLMKAHRTNDVLVKQLDTCAEHDVDSILRENASLKSYVSRLSRENAVLRGLQSRHLNTRLQTFERAMSAFGRRNKQRPFNEDEHARALKIVIRANNQRESTEERRDGYSQDWSTNS